MLTLEECLSKAAIGSPELLREKEALFESRAVYSISKAALLPQLDASLSYQRYHDQPQSKRILFGATHNDYYSDVTLRQLLFSGGKYITQLRLAEVAVSAQRQRLDQTNRELTLAVTRAYYEQARAMQALQIHKNVLEKLSQQRVVTQLLYNGGKVSVVDMLKIQTNEAAQLDVVKNLENQVYVKALALGQVVGVQEPLYTTAELPTINSEVEYQKELPESVLNSNPEMLYATKNIERSILEQKLAAAGHYPSVYFKGAYYMEDGTFFPGNANNYVGVFLSLPLYAGNAISAAVDRATARSAQARESARKTRLSLYARYAAAISSALDKKERVTTSAKTLELAKEALIAAELRYSAGKISVLELLDAQNLWSSAYLAYANVVFDYLISAAEVKAIWPQAIKGEILK